MSGVVHYFAGKYPGKVGMLISPGSWKTPPFYMPYALDNGAFTGFNENDFYFMLRKAKLLKNKPLWVAVPDVVGDRQKTLEMWEQHQERVKAFGFNLAFVAQDGMTINDVPEQANCVFIGGTTEWKLNRAHEFKTANRKLHIGRVNTMERLQWAARIKADSVDGTGFFRGRKKQYQDFIDFFETEKQKTFF